MKKLLKLLTLSIVLTFAVGSNADTRPLSLPSFNITSSLSLSYATVSMVLIIDADGNVVSSAVTTAELGYLSGVTSAIQTQLDTLTSSVSTNTTNIAAKQPIANTRYSLGDISGAVAVDYSNGNVQAATTTAAVTGITFSNLATETSMRLIITNTSGYSVTYGSTEIISSSETGIYMCRFYNDNSTIYFAGKTELQN